MGHYLLIANGTVKNKVVANPDWADDQAQSGVWDYVIDEATLGGQNPGPGWKTPDGVTFTPPPEPDPAELPPAPLSPLDFIRRFTKAERKDIRRAAKQDEDLDDFLYLLQMAGSVHLDNQDTIDGVNALEQAGIIAAGRAAEILAP